jgi:hypothetical protein
MKIRNYYLDTEFSEGFFKPISWLPGWLSFNKPQWSIELISVGIVTDDGREYYAINKNFRRSRCNHWVKENVLPLLPSRTLMAEPTHKDPWPEGNVPNPIYKSIQTISHDIKEFVIPFNEINDLAPFGGLLSQGLDKWKKENEVVFKAYYADYDWVMICTIFGTMMDLPEGFPMYCVDLKQTLDEFAMSTRGQMIACIGEPAMGIYNDLNKIPLDLAIKKITGNILFPKQSNEHSALHDSRWNRELNIFLKSFGF